MTNILLFLGLFVFAKDVTKTKYLQILTTVMRWTAFIIMITLAGLRLSRGIIFRPPVSDFSGVPNLFGVCFYSFMCHHSLPSLGNMPFLVPASQGIWYYQFCYQNLFWLVRDRNSVLVNGIRRKYWYGSQNIFCRSSFFSNFTHFFLLLGGIQVL